MAKTIKKDPNTISDGAWTGKIEGDFVRIKPYKYGQVEELVYFKGKIKKITLRSLNHSGKEKKSDIEIQRSLTSDGFSTDISVAGNKIANVTKNLKEISITSKDNVCKIIAQEISLLKGSATIVNPKVDLDATYEWEVNAQKTTLKESHKGVLSELQWTTESGLAISDSNWVYEPRTVSGIDFEISMYEKESKKLVGFLKKKPCIDILKIGLMTKETIYMPFGTALGSIQCLTFL